MQPVDLIIFGASGDLSARKLFPALFQLDRANLLPTDFRIAAIARDNIDLGTFLSKLRARMSTAMGNNAPSDDEWQQYSRLFSYLNADFSRPTDFSIIKTWIDDQRVSLFYLATPPSLFAPICDYLSQENCLTGDCRIVLEKPIGENLDSSIVVNGTLAQYFSESSIYRIDHYLGKETVQNLLALRFANRFINSQWDQSCIDHIQITVAEVIGIEGR